MDHSSKGASGLDARKRHLLALLLKEKGVDPLQTPIVRQPRRAPGEITAFPLSFEQERLWVLEQIEPGNVAYNLFFGLRLTGPLDIPALERTFTEVVRRHQILRTTYRSTGGRPEQQVHPAAPFALPMLDLAGLPEESREPELLRLAATEAAWPFDLGRAVMRARLLRLGPERHACLLTLHHIATDGWSNGILIREVMTVYEAFAAGRPSPLAELPVQYADFAVWQREVLRGALLEEQVAFWRERLAGVPVLDLPTDFPRPAVPALEGGRVTLPLGPELAEAARDLARAESATLFMLVGAAWQALLSRYSGQTDLSFGTAVANRHRTETEELIGFFVNTLVIRGDLSGDPAFRELLARMRKGAGEAFAHQALPFSRVVEALNPERSLAHTPLFQVLLGIGNAPGTELEVRGLAFQGLESPFQAAMFDLNLMVAEHQGRLVARLEYRRDLFAEATAERLLRHFEVLLAGAVEDPGRRLSELPLLTDAERGQVLGEWARGERRADPEVLVHERIAALAAEEPDRPALIGLDGEVSRGELDRRAGLLARRLAALGVGPEVRVGLCLRDPAAMVTGMLAAFKAGGAYVPLDPDYPRERLAFLAADAGLAAVLVDGETDAVVPEVQGLKRVRVEEVLSGPGDEAVPARAGLGNAAYVIYTSGSTGRPKGVVIDHRALVDLVASNIRLFGLTPDDRYLQAVSFNFDVSVTEIFPVLAAGGAVALTDRRSPLAGDALAAALRGATAAFIPPSMLATVPPGESFPALRALAVGGERVPAELAARWAPGRRFLDIYGPTESCVDAVIWEAPPQASPADLLAAAPPIGRPVPNSFVRIFDRHGAPAPVGGPGELLLGGLGLARGYLDRPDLTAERFVPDPFAEKPGERLYRTGDRVRWRPDSQIDYLGRIDHQVKVRGVRIETGEIESVLREHPAVRDAAVIAVQDPALGTSLHAFAVPAAPAEISEEGLRAFLRERLPELLLPARLTLLEALPITPNGKLDRRELERLDAEAVRGRQAARWVPPRPGTEARLAELWAEVLGREQIGGVGGMDNFFELGGHSLLATQLVSRVREAFQVDLPQRALFEVPTLAGLAARLDNLIRQGTGKGAALDAREAGPIAGRAPAEGPYPLSFAQERLWVLDQLEPGGSAYNIPAALDLTGELRLPVLEAALAEVVRRHETLRTRFETAGGKPVQVIAPAAPVAVPLADLTALPAARREAEALRLAQEEAARPFDLERGPVLRALLIRRHGPGETGRHALVVNVHHIASDGWSNGVLVREVTALYAAFDEGRPSPLPELGVRYVDYAWWQRERLQGEALEAELGYWREQLAGVPPLLELPTDKPRPALQGFAGAAEGWDLDPEVGAGLSALAQREGATLFMVVMAAFQALLSRYTHQTDVPVGTPVAGRGRTELEGLIGFFVNTLVIRTDLAGDPPFRDLLGRVRRVALDAFAHQEVPFEKLVEELNPERSLAHSPLFQAMLALQNAPEPALAMPGLTFAGLALEPGAAKLDLSLSLGEVAGPGNPGDTGTRLAGALEYRTDLFEAATARRMLGHLDTLLAGVVADPGRPLSDLPLLPAAEREQVLHGWAEGPARPGPEATFPEMFVARAAAAPESPALVSREGTVSYGDLDRWADRLARRLRALGAGPEDRVGVCLERSPALIAGLLGALKAGAAYVPLDPAYPAERLAFLAEDAGLAAVLVSEATADRLPGLAEVPRVLVEEAAASEPLEPLPFPDPDSPAYVIYTSGSTGRPKGVVVPHRGLANQVRTTVELLDLRPGDRYLQIVSVSFDASAMEIFPALAAGAVLGLTGPGGLPVGEALASIWEDLAVTVAVMPPSVLRTVDAGRPFPALRLVGVGGEKCPADLVQSWVSDRVGGRRFLNFYGPTEASVYVTAWESGVHARSAAGLPTLGRPTAGSRVLVLDPAGMPAGMPVPAGVTGELCLGGAGLARGYLGRPDLTAASFVPDSFSAEPGGRLYRSGDLGRWLPTGELEILGRLDEQVKVRGVRVETAEVEAALAAHPAVAAASVLVEQDAAGGRLLAFVAGTVSPAELRAFLRERLPEAWIPSRILALDALPLTPNGKVDRDALRRRAAELEAAVPEASTAPLTGTEELLAALWAGVLGLERVGRHDDFFQLGGHSLLATQLVSRVRETFGVELPQRALFEEPTVAGLAGRIEALRRDESRAPLDPADIVPLVREDDPPGVLPPLSFAQQRLWVIDQIEPGSNAYNIPLGLRLVGPLDRPALAAAFTELARRHESLRTTFTTVLEEGEAVPVQVVHPAEEVLVPLPLADLSALPADRREAELRELAQGESGRPFDLTADLLLRALLVRLEGGETPRHALFLTVHHIAADGWSGGVLVREMVALYGAFSRGLPSPLPELPVRYRDYARWQRRRLQGEALEALLGYWRRQLAGVPVLELPADRPRPDTQPPGGDVVEIVIPRELTDGLHGLARREGATLFMVLMAAYQALLARVAGQTDVAVGTPVAGRRRVELEGLIGFFVNTLVLRGDLSGDPPVPELIARTRTAALDAFAHQDVPFEKLVEELNPERSFAHSPLFQVMLVLLNTPAADDTEASGLAFEPLETGDITAKYDLTFQLSETPGGLAGTAEYRPDLFDRATVERLVERFQILLAGLVADPARRLSELPLLTAAESALLAEWNDTAAPEAAWNLEERLAAVAAARAEAPAVAFAGRSYSYGEMDAATRRLAARLRELGVGPDVRVGVCAERSPEMIAAVVAVVRAGGAYVPVDPAYPAERVAVMLGDSRAPVLLTQERLLATLPPFAGRVELLDGLFEAGAAEAPALPLPAVDPDNLLYVLYTSGSTGRPKGVALSRRALVNLLEWQERGPLPGSGRTLQFASLSFDVSFQEIFSTWLGGDTLVLVDEDTRRDPRALLALLAAERVERAFLPVVALRQMAEAAAEAVEAGEGEAPTVRDVAAAGEQLLVSPAVREWLARLPGARLHNYYGPTETHVTTYHVLDGDPREWPAVVPIGRPLPNHRIHILDAHLGAVPVGSLGEVWAAGAGLARGYLDRPDLTAERFVPDPFAVRPGERLYRVGDLARWRPDGVLEFAGRRDGQVKVRGVRVETGEVESTLALHPGVRQAVVLALPEADGSLRLVAFYLSEPESPAAATDLRDFLRDRLPAAYVPSAFVPVEAFPLTPSGKVDRRTLAQRELEPTDAAAESYLAPRTQTEELLAGIWGGLLGVSRVGREDSFFDLGGHSLLATQLVSRVRRTFGVELPQRALFEAPTVAELAARVEEAQRAGLSAALAPLGPIEPGALSAGRPPRLSFAQERLWLLAQMEADNAAYNLPVALRITGPLDPAVLAATFAEVARRHATLRTTYGVVAGDRRPVQIAAPPGPVPLPLLDLSALPPERRETEVLRLSEEEANRPFDLGAGPVLRVRLIRLAAGSGADGHALLLNVHHIASDGWSNGVLVREVTQLYAAFAAGRPSPLPELPIQYADFARWQRRAVRGEALEATLAYWRRQLAGVPALELPTDRPRPPFLSPAGSSEGVELGGGLAAGLRDLVRREGATLFMGVMAAFQALLHRYSGQGDFAVGTPIAGRNRIETEGLIGFFVNTLAIRADFREDPPFAELLRRVRRTSLEAFAYQDLPFEKLVEELNPERSLAHTPLFQVMAALQNTPAAELAAADLTFAPLEAPSHTAKFDLSLSLSETPEGLAGGIEYRTALFEAATVRRMMGHLATLLASALSEPERPVSELPLLSAAERGQLVTGWNDTDRPALGEGFLHELFADRARELPDAPALWSAGATVSYGELYGRVARLAGRLRELGVGPEVRVGVFQDRSVEMIVAVMGVLTAGGAYVPLDPAYPADRLEFMAEDAGIAAVVVNERTADRAPGGPAVPRVLVAVEAPSPTLPRFAGEGAPARDDEQHRTAPADSELSGVAGDGALSHAQRGGGLGRGSLHPDHLAYIIYTSGSTGRPKGVAIHHRGAVSMARATIEVLRLAPGERFLQFASLSFDGSVAEIFSALGSGACLCLIGREALPSGEVLAAALRQPDVTTSLIPPSVLATLGEQRFPSLHTLLVSAEKCPAEIARQWAPGRRFINIYGPTEASVYMTIWEAGQGTAGLDVAPPIGVPIANSRAFVLDRSGKPVPVGVSGELFLGGICLARGYFGRPDKTAELFVPDPFAGEFGETGGRLYRTGDLCRWRNDGHLEILGRIDHQVKVRGFRIELGEIETVLLDHPAVRRAAVISRPGPGGPRLIAYVVPEEGAAGFLDGDPLPVALRVHLRDRLPEFMMPAAFVELPELPINNSGKLDRAALPEPGGERPELATAYVAPHEGLESALTAIWQETLGVERVGVEDNFFDLGGHSLLMVELQGRIREGLGREVSLLELFRYPNVGALARFLEGAEAAPVLAQEPRKEERPGSRDIAVVGMAARFPGAPDLETFWRRLRAGDELITFFTEEELVAAGIPREMAVDPAYVPACGVLEGSDLFDAGLFDINPREAQLMDPQQRLLLECSLEALERAGYGAGSLSLAPGAEAGGGSRGPRVGVFAGGGMSSYGLHNLFGRALGSGMEVTLGNDKDFLATRVAYKLNLRGPAFTVQTACSTSLVAIHLACQSLLAGECDMALAGGVTAQYPMHAGYFYEENGVLSEDGHTRTFDARAHGTVNSNGVGVVTLKPLAAALADGDPIHAVIKASAINNDGAEKIGFTAPSEEGQAQVIAEAQALGGVAPETLGFVETHGTATPVGDPIEVAALTRAFKDRGSSRSQYCALGSVKTNLGHTGSAAGVAGFLKAALAVEHGEIPPSLHFEEPNPALALESSPFYVATSLTPWPVDGGSPRRAAVSSFGLGGTNAHAVLEQAPAREPSGRSREWQLLCLSARSQAALEAATDRLIESLKRLPDEAFADAAYTLQVGRRGWEHRRVVVCRDRQDALAALDGRDPRRVLGNALPRGGAGSRPVAFVFSGLGEQYPGMAAGLYRGEPAFREAFDRCAAVLQPLLGADLRELLFPGGAQPEDGGGLDLRRLLGRAPSAELGPLDRTAVLQPALFAVEYALAELWREWGVEPRAVIGYSLGEYVAACVAGVLPLEDALRLVAERARLIDALPEGAMLAVSLPEEEVLPLLEETDLSLAAVNGPALCVVAGPVDTVATLEQVLREDGVAHRRLRTTHAFHSAMMAPAAGPLAGFVRTLSLRPPRIPYVSNVTGTWITPEQATDPAYWAEHLVRPVRFAEGIGELWRDPGRVLLEIGPGGSLAALALQHPAAGENPDPVALSTLRSAYEAHPDQAVLLGAFGKLWLAGARVDGRALYARERRHRVALPAYPFERQRYWIEVEVAHGAGPAGAGSPTGLYTPSWRRSEPLPAPAAETVAGGRWLVFVEPGMDLGERVVRRLRERGAAVATVSAGEGFAQPAAGAYVLAPRKTEDYDALLGALLQQWGAPPDRIVHLWTALETPEPAFEEAQERGFYSLLFLTQSLARWQMAAGREPEALRALVASSGVHRVTGVDALRPANAPLASLCRSLSLEVPGVVCRFVDVAGMAGRSARLADALLAELLADEPEAVALRGGERWVRTFEPVRDAGEPEAALPGNTVLVLAGRPDPLLVAAAEEAAGAAGARSVLLEEDLEDEEAVRAALARIAATVGPVAGVLAADVPGSEPPPLMSAYVTREHADGFLRTTARRLAALAGAVGSLESPPLFCAAVTSLASLAAEPDHGLQAALESLVDTFARQRDSESETAWASIAWDRAADCGTGGAPREVAALALRRILALVAAGAAQQVVLSPEDLAGRLHRAGSLSEGADAASGAAGPIALHARPNLRNAYVAPQSETEKSVAEIWQGLLGLEQVGIHDSFFDLGGDSLLAAQIFTRLREQHGVEIALAEFFEQPTPAAVAARIDAVRSEGETEADKLARMLAQLDSLSPEEVERMLAERGLGDLGQDG